MVASTIGVFVLAGMIQVLGSSKTTFLVTSAIAEVQQGGYYAINAVAEPLRYRGFQGCLMPVEIQNRREDNINWQTEYYIEPVANDFPSDNIARSNLRGYTVASDGTWSPDPAASTIDSDINALRNGIDGITPRPGSDVVSVQYASRDSLQLSVNMNNKSDVITTQETVFSLTENDIVFIGDCSVGDIFRVSNEPTTTPPIVIAHASSHNTTNLLERPYTTDARMRLFRSETYFVADSGRNNELGEDVYSLFRYSTNGDVDEIAEGVEFLKLRYGEQVASGNIRFLQAGDVNLNMRRVVSIEVGILAKSLHAALPEEDTRNYILPGGVIGASQHGGGRYLRKVFHTTVQMRNKG
jgi:type IV pilus assembly protein PilW